MRTIELIGRLAADAERKVSKSGGEYISFRVANNEFSDEKGADGKPKTYWFSVTSFRHIHMSQYLTKGKPVFIRGDYSDRVYQTRDGNCEVGRDIIASEIKFIDFGNNDKNNTKVTQVTQTSQTVPQTQVKMEAPKPTTAELKVPSQDTSVSDEDELPF